MARPEGAVAVRDTKQNGAGPVLRFGIAPDDAPDPKLIDYREAIVSGQETI